jgi:drug/metabolite transporter (DMT)-like permease
MSAQPYPNLFIGFAVAIFATLLFSLKSIFIKFLYVEGLNADSVLVLRMALSLPIYAGILVWAVRHQNRLEWNKNVIFQVILLGFFGYFLASLLDLMGLELISASLERLSLMSYPFMVAILSFLFFKERLTPRLLFSIIISYFGLWLVMGEQLSSETQVNYGVFLVLASALSFALYMLFSKQFIQQLGVQIFTRIAMLASCFFGLLYGVLVLDMAQLNPTQNAWFWLILLVIFSTVIPSFMMAEAISRIGSVRTSLVGMLGPVFTIALAVYWLDEPLTILIIVGVILMIGGVMSLMRHT